MFCLPDLTMGDPAPSCDVTATPAKLPRSQLKLKLTLPGSRHNLADHRSLHRTLRRLRCNPRLFTLHEGISLHEAEDLGCPTLTPDTSKHLRHTSYFPSFTSWNCDSASSRAAFHGWSLRGSSPALSPDVDYGWVEKGEECLLSENGDFIVVQRKLSLFDHKVAIGGWIAFLLLVVLAIVLFLSGKL